MSVKSEIEQIILFFPNFSKGGLENSLVRISNLLSIKYRLIIVGNNLPSNQFYKKIKLYDLSNKFRDNIIYKLLKKIIPNFFFNVVFTTFYLYKNFSGKIITFQSPLLITILNLIIKKFKIIIRESNNIEFCQTSRIKKILNKFQKKISWSLSDYVINISKDTAKDNMNYLNFNTKQQSYIYNPINKVELLSLSKKEDVVFDKSLINFVSVGRLEDQKNFSYLLDIFKILNSKINCKLHIIGSGSLINNLRLMVESYELNNNVNFYGHLSNPFPYIKKADFFILTPKFEGLGNTFLESILLETKTISSNVSGPREILQNGNCGLLIPLNNVKQSANMIYHYIKNIDLHKKHIKNMKKNIYEYDPENILTKWNKILDGI